LADSQLESANFIYMVIGIDASRANLKYKTGTEWYSFNLIKNFAELDQTNTYWLYLNRAPAPELIAAISSNTNFSFKVLYWPFQAFWTLGRLTLEMLWHSPDVLFVPAHTLPLFSPRKTVNTIHDIAFEYDKTLYRSLKVKTDKAALRPLIDWLVHFITLGHYRSGSVDYLDWSTSFALRHAKKIIAVSEITKQDLLQSYPEARAEKIRVIHNGFNDELYHPVDDEQKITEVLNKYDLDRQYLLYVGRLERKKNTAALVEAFALWKENNPDSNLKLLLVGNAGFGFDEINYIIEEFNLSKEVLMPGWVSAVDLPYIVAAAKAFISPSRYEGFGITLLESLACGVPTAVSNLPVFKEVAGDAVLYFDQNDKKSMVMAIDRVVNDEGLRQELKTKGLARAHQFSWRKCASETKDLLTSL